MKIFSIILIITSVAISLFIFWKIELPHLIFARALKINSSSFVEGQYKGALYRFSKPKDYEATKGKHDNYPLVIYLHGGGERGDDNNKQIHGLTMLGNGYNKLAKSYQSHYPSFVYVPQCPTKSSWDNKTIDLVVETITDLINKYPIDTKRIYLIGYSMGGSGTYALASQYYLATNQSFAAIVRLAGQGSFKQQVHQIVSKSSIWLHIGLKDTGLRIEKARKAYRILKEIHQNTIEKTEKTDIPGHPGTTLTLRLGDKEIVKKTEYSEDGHSISSFPFSNSELMTWVFKQHQK